MIEIIVATHGKFAEGIKDSVSMIVGNYDNFETVAFNPGESIEVLEEKIEAAVIKKDIKQALILVDVFAASPFNASMKVYSKLRDQKEIRIITGVNLPMVMGALMASDTADIDELTATLISESRDSITDAVANVTESTDDGDDDY